MKQRHSGCRCAEFAAFIAATALLTACSDGGASRARVEDGFKENPPSWQFAFDLFLEREGIPIYEGYGAGPVDQLVLEPWERLGGRGAYLKLHGHQGMVSTFVHELGPGEKSKPERHVYDEILYVYSGQGIVRIWQAAAGLDGTMTEVGERLDVQRGSLLSPPLNSFHQIENLGDRPMRIVGFTNAPPVIDMYRNDRFVFDNDFIFDERWAGEGGFFAPGPEPGADLPRGDAKDPFRVNFVPDVHKLETVMHRWKKKKADFATFWMSGGALSPHVSKWDEESYQTAHRHNGGATVLLLSGEGYYMMWPSAAGPQPFQDGSSDAVVREDFVPGGLYSPPDDWYHLHFNSGPSPALYLAVTPQGRQHRLGYVPHRGHSPVVSELEGEVDGAAPILIPRRHEDPRIGRDFERAVRERRERGVGGG